MLAHLDDSKQTAHGIQVLVFVQELTDVLQKLLEHVLTDVFVIQNWFTRIVLRLSDKKLFNASSCIRLVDRHLRFEILGEQLHKLEHIVVWDLIAEHVNELDACRLEDWKLVELTGICNLKLWHNQGLQIVFELFHSNSHI